MLVPEISPREVLALPRSSFSLFFESHRDRLTCWWTVLHLLLWSSIPWSALGGESGGGGKKQPQMVQGILCDRQMILYWVLRFSIKNSCTTWMLTQSALVLWMHLFIMFLYSLDMAWVQGDSGATRLLPRIPLNSRGEGDITGRELKEHGQRSSLHHPGRVLRDLPFPKKWTCEQSTCTLWVLELGGHCKQRSCLPWFTLKRTSSLLCYLIDLTEVVVELTPRDIRHVLTQSTVPSST